MSATNDEILAALQGFETGTGEAFGESNQVAQSRHGELTDVLDALGNGIGGAVDALNEASQTRHDESMRELSLLKRAAAILVNDVNDTQMNLVRWVACSIVGVLVCSFFMLAYHSAATNLLQVLIFGAIGLLLGFFVTLLIIWLIRKSRTRRTSRRS